jgi:hypothetical protein
VCSVAGGSFARQSCLSAEPPDQPPAALQWWQGKRLRPPVSVHPAWGCLIGLASRLDLRAHASNWTAVDTAEDDHAASETLTP